MKSKERLRGLARSPKLAWDVIFRGRYRFVYDRMPITMTKMSWKKRVNLFKAGLNLVYRRLTPLNMPLHMQVELTNYCNLRCPICPSGTRALNRRPQAIDVDLFEHLMDQVGPYLLTLSLWAWGEPLLHPRLQEILRVTRKHRITTFLSTNGQNLDQDRIIDALVNEPPTYLIVAIDGLTDETHSKYRVGAKMAPILEGVQKIAAIKERRGLRLPVLHMRYIVMKHNQHEVPQLKSFAQTNRFDCLSVRTLSIIDTDSPDETHVAFVPDMKDFRAYEYDNGARIEKGDFLCQEPFWFPSVFADGTVVACEQDYNAHAAFGVISRGDSFLDLWRSPRASRIRKIVRDTPNRLSFCRNCPYRDRSGTDCSVSAHYFSRNIPYADLTVGAN